MPDKMRDFRNYGNLEAFNIVAVPGFALFFAPPTNIHEGAVFALAAMACAIYLFIGTKYWWALDKRLKRSDNGTMNSALKLADRIEIPSLILLAASFAGVVAGLVTMGLVPAVIAAGVLTLLALLEYVNYYHYQLMNFDNWSDFRRLVSTRKLRRPHMARDLARYRAQR